MIIPVVLKSALKPLIIIGFLLFVQIGVSFDFLSVYDLGIIPLSNERIYAIFTFPLAHTSWKHLSNNALSLLLTGSTLNYLYASAFWRIYFSLYLHNGILVWLFGNSSALGVGFSSFTYALTFFVGITLLKLNLLGRFYKYILYLILIGIVFSIYLDYYRPNISWQGHLLGSFVGILLGSVNKITKHPVTVL